MYMYFDYCKFLYFIDKSFNVKFYFIICNWIYFINRYVYLFSIFENVFEIDYFVCVLINLYFVFYINMYGVFFEEK